MGLLEQVDLSVEAGGEVSAPGDESGAFVQVQMKSSSSHANADSLRAPVLQLLRL
jgi:hypothetical protein